MVESISDTVGKKNVIKCYNLIWGEKGIFIQNWQKWWRYEEKLKLEEIRRTELHSSVTEEMGLATRGLPTAIRLLINVICDKLKADYFREGEAKRLSPPAPSLAVMD